MPVQFRLEIEEGGEKLTVTDADGNKAFAYGDAEPQPARTDPTESLQRSLSKTGGTPFAVEKIDVEMDGGPWYVPGSAVNELRRDALEALLEKRGRSCAPGLYTRRSRTLCPCAPCRPAAPCAPALKLGIRCRSRP